MAGTGTLTRTGGPGPGDPGVPPGAEQRSAFLRLAIIVAAGVVAAVATGVGRTVAVLGAIVALIMLHELGHFATAKWCGMKVTEYFLGFGPRLWSVRRGETEYGIKAIPAGGYVKIAGMTNLDKVDPADENRTYRASTFPRKLLVVSAGSLMHFLIALVLLWTLLAAVGTVNYNRPSLSVGSLSQLATGQSPAQQAGLRIGDRIVAVDGHTVSRWDQLSPLIQPRAGQATTIEIVRDGRDLTLSAVPVDLNTVQLKNGQPRTSAGKPYGFLGVGPSYPVERVSPLGAVPQSFTAFGRTGWASITALRTIFSHQGLDTYASQITGRAPNGGTNVETANRFLGPVGLVTFASQAGESGLRDVLALLIAFNIFLGLFNLLPLLPLDGGHVLIACYERIRSRAGRRYRVDIRHWLPVTYAVLALLLALAVVSTWADIFHPPPNPFQ